MSAPSEGRYTPFGPGIGALSAIAQVVMCEDCGAIVADVAVHDRFHSILSGHAWALAVLKTAHLAAHVHDRYDVPERIDSRKFDSWTNDALAEVAAEIAEDLR